MTERADFSVDDAKRIANVVQRVEGQRPGRKPNPTRKDLLNSPIVPVMLLEDLKNGYIGKAAVLKPDLNRTHQLIRCNGEVKQNFTFNLEWGDGEAKFISMSATPAELEAALQSLPGITNRDVEVDFGNHTRGVSREIVSDDETEVYESFAYNTYCWIVTFTGRYENADHQELMEPSVANGNGFSYMSSQRINFRDSGQTIDITSIPVGQTTTGDTILKRGAIGTAGYIEGYGYILLNLEVRILDY
ncbi:MAG: hypothetical protein HUJ26_19015 [Planctomycetaceae bacterium]|nr:hypothetical protein [Planctomycetaceae bacterium]